VVGIGKVRDPALAAAADGARDALAAHAAGMPTCESVSGEAHETVAGDAPSDVVGPVTVS
jgi:hypothetical protein